MTEYRISLGKDHLTFCAGHFITYGGGRCEALHGHNYRAAVTVSGRLDEHSLVYDFVSLKEEMQRIVGALDHKMLLPEENPLLDIERRDREIEVRHGERRFVFPREDVVFLPVANTTAELLADYLSRCLATRLAEHEAPNLHEIEVEVEESPGLSGRCHRRLEP